MTQQQVAELIHMHRSNYNKMKNGIREPSVTELQKLARLFNMTVDQILNMDTNIPDDITLEDKSGIEQMFLIKQFKKDGRTVVFQIIDAVLTKKKFKDFFQIM